MAGGNRTESTASRRERALAVHARKRAEAQAKVSVLKQQDLLVLSRFFGFESPEAMREYAIEMQRKADQREG